MTGFLIRKKRLAHRHTHGISRGDRKKKTATYKPKREVSKETSPAGVISDF